MSRGGCPAAHCLGALFQEHGSMKDLFFVRRRGETARISQSLAVQSDGIKYRLQYLVLDRTNPTKAERASGAKEERIEVLNQEFFLNVGDFIRVSDFPLPKLTREFIHFLKESQEHGSES